MKNIHGMVLLCLMSKNLFAQTLLDESFLQNCQPEINKISCDGKIFLATDAGFGLNYFPQNILGLPQGLYADVPQSSENALLSLGTGGWITLKFQSKVYNLRGDDLRVFENPFLIKDFDGNVSGHLAFTEPAMIEVSQDGVNFYRFPNEIVNLKDPYKNKGFAGMFPVYANQSNDPFSPQVLDTFGERIINAGPGGDDFDLDDLEVPLDWIQYIRIIDASKSRYPGGFDLDTVVGLH